MKPRGCASRRIRELALRQAQHGGRDIRREHVDTAVCQPQRILAGAAVHLEHPRSGANRAAHLAHTALRIMAPMVVAVNRLS